MARYLGYLWRCVVGLLGLSVSAHAVVIGGVEYTLEPYYYQGVAGVTGSTPLQACLATASVQSADCQSTSLVNDTTCRVTCTNGYTVTQGISKLCPDGTLNHSGDAQAPAGCYRQVPADPCSAGAVLGAAGTRWTYQGDYPGFGGYCIGGCGYALYGTEGYDKTSGMSTATGYMRSTGSTCTGNETPRTTDSGVNNAQPTTQPTSSTPDPSACKSGEVPYTGTVNGKTVTVCGAPSKTSGTQSESTTKSTSTTTNNNGTQTTNTTNTTESTTKKTTCENGTCTTTTHSTGSSGGGSGTSGGSSSSGSETKTEPQESFCKNNPQSPICKEGTDSSFGGSCGAFSCSGDAVQCAQARAAHELLCEVKLSDTDPNVIAGKTGASGGLVPGDHPGANGQTQAFALSSMLDSTPLFGTSGDCIADKTVPMMGQTLTLPFSRMCGALELLGNAFLAACFLAAGMIVFRT